jgi:membrane-associated phospholipid phosphatase
MANKKKPQCSLFAFAHSALLDLCTFFIYHVALYKSDAQHDKKILKWILYLADSRAKRKWNVGFYPVDKLFIGFWGLLAILSLIFHARVPIWPSILITGLIASFVVFLIARWDDQARSQISRVFHHWAPFALVVFTYKQIYFLIPAIRLGQDYDGLLIAIDRWLFHVNPTQWLAQCSNPVLTEILQLCYSSFYLLFIAAGLELYLKNRLRELRFFTLTNVYGFFLSYIAYFIFPAIGPRFTLHDFSRIDTDLPGVFFTPALRWFVNVFEAIQRGMTNSAAMASAQRDVFPSGHTMMTILVIAMAWRLGLKVRPWILAIGILLIFATVYLRYHYVIDVIAGAVLAVPCLLTSKKLFDFLEDA